VGLASKGLSRNWHKTVWQDEPGNIVMFLSSSNEVFHVVTIRIFVPTTLFHQARTHSDALARSLSSEVSIWQDRVLQQIEMYECTQF
jgi:hypothetical protein